MDAVLLVQPEEKALLKALSMLPEEIRLAARDYDPSRINRYLVSCQAISTGSIMPAVFGKRPPPCGMPASSWRIPPGAVIAGGLGLLGVSAPEKM